MHTKAIKYRDNWLAPGSDAFLLHQERKFKELDQHLKQLDLAAKSLEGRYGNNHPARQ